MKKSDLKIVLGKGLEIISAFKTTVYHDCIIVECQLGNNVTRSSLHRMYIQKLVVDFSTKLQILFIQFPENSCFSW